jgi:MoxR-like ATPase
MLLPRRSSAADKFSRGKPAPARPGSLSAVSPSSPASNAAHSPPVVPAAQQPAPLQVLPGGAETNPIEAAPSADQSPASAGSIARLDFSAAASESAPKQNRPQKSASDPLVNAQYQSDFVVENPGWRNVGTPDELIHKLDQVGYQCYHFLAVQLCLLFSADFNKIRALLLEGPSGCGKSFMAKSLAKITGAEMMCLSCYKGMPTANLIESPSTLAMVNAMAGKELGKEPEKLMNLGILSRAFLASRDHPVLLLIDELDKPEGSIDTFFLGPIQDARIWLESRAPIDANVDNLLLVFTKNFNRKLDEALLRRIHPVKMSYLDSTLERKILSPHCHPQLVANLVTVADRMRNTGGSYQFERPPAPEELLTAGLYIQQMLDWNMTEFSFLGRNVWAILAKSEHDRAVLEHMLRFHPDFMDPLFPDGKNMPLEEVYAKLGRLCLERIVSDQRATEREAAWKNFEYN